MTAELHYISIALIQMCVQVHSFSCSNYHGYSESQTKEKQKIAHHFHYYPHPQTSANGALYFVAQAQ